MSVESNKHSKHIPANLLQLSTLEESVLSKDSTVDRKEQEKNCQLQNIQPSEKVLALSMLRHQAKRNSMMKCKT